MQTIKPIETRYKGYRFRSRLEARWAVFFDAVDVKYQYEPEGYDLAEHGYYLPDFFLPDQNVWVEVKPPVSERALGLYLAGKIGKNGWRNDILGWHNRPDADFETPLTWQPLALPELNYAYTGPFFVSDDHGCGHGNKTHGQRPEGCLSIYEPPNTALGHGVMLACLDAIDRSDIVFAWIDSLDCFATLIELGYARNRTEIYVGVDEKLKDAVGYFGATKEQINEAEKADQTEDALHKLFGKSLGGEVGRHELWFLEAMSDKFCFADTAQNAFNRLCPIPPEKIKIDAVAAQTGGTGVVVHGDPVDALCYFIRAARVWCPKAKSAAENARAARFEHGENGAP